MKMNLPKKAEEGAEEPRSDGRLGLNFGGDVFIAIIALHGNGPRRQTVRDDCNKREISALALDKN